jgi:4-hydroxythreonine-4-phosphate dehydrogenase
MSAPRALPRIAITMGDPAGVGPEICLRALAEPRVGEICVPIVFGDASVLERVGRELGLSTRFRIIRQKEFPAVAAELADPAVLDIGAIADASAVQPGIVNAETGRAAFEYIERSIQAAMTHEVGAVATGPIHKEALRAAGVQFPGHTEIYAERTGAERACMMLTSRELTCSFVTVHVGYRDVPGLLSVRRVLDVIELSADFVRKLRGREPRIIVCGLNPHAGESGLFGDGEEERFIAPAIEAARAKGLTVEGPLPPDTAFLPARRKVTDVFVCMYHDQGHIPLKMLAFDEAVNVTLGLPIIRTSVDHGTALDIAWQGKANPNSLYEAIRVAAALCPRAEGPV